MGRVWGMALWNAIEKLGRRVNAVFLAKERQNADGWTGFLASLLEAPDPGGRVLLINASTPGLSEQEAATFLTPRGFEAYHRFGLVFPPGTPLPPDARTPLRDGDRIRSLSPSDLDSLAVLNAACYADSIDRFIFGNDIDPLRAAQDVLRSLFEGHYGKFVPDASFGLEIDGAMKGATLVTRQPRYNLLADVEVHPSLQGRGHARRLIRLTLEVVSRDPAIPFVLAVTEETPKAFRLYRDLGFVVQEGPFTFWANTIGLGLRVPPDATGRVPSRAG